jgi:mRNA-degrading endonuclease RelE of RelBE toxin-antitoxin system
MFEATEYWITVVALKNFDRSIDGLLTEDEFAGLVTYLANHPDSGAVIPETGGIRKLRWGARGRGKSGGARIIYYFRDLNMPLYLLTAYGKGEKIDLSKAEKTAMRLIVDEIVQQQWKNDVAVRVMRIRGSL